MTTPRKKAAPKAGTKAEGTFARLRREAAEMRENDDRPSLKDLRPYVIDDADPPIVIQPPSIDALLTMAELTEPGGGIQVRNVRAMARTLCGDQYDRVMELLSDGDEYDLLVVINDIRESFTPGVGSDNVPGK